MSLEGNTKGYTSFRGYFGTNHAHNIRYDIERVGEQRMLDFRGYFRVITHNIRDAIEREGEQRR